MKKLYCVIYGRCRKIEKHKASYFSEKSVFSIIWLFKVSARMKMKKYLKT